jgi:hypothetical protein
VLGSVRETRVVIWKRTWSSVASERAIFFSSFDTEMVQPALVRTERELALRAENRRRARKDHAARAAKRTDSELLKRHASIPQNRTLGCEDRAESHAQLQDFIRAAQDAIVLAGSRLLAVERALQEQVRQDMRALQGQARQDMRAGKQVIAYPGVASTAQPLQHRRQRLVRSLYSDVSSAERYGDIPHAPSVERARAVVLAKLLAELNRADLTCWLYGR